MLEDVSFAIQKGETIAIVGENGAGKSTLVRILSGILKPDQGEILVDGKNLFSADADSRFQKVSGVFQQFIRYQMSLRDNVEISGQDSDEERMKESLAASEFSLDEKWEEGYDTMLSGVLTGSISLADSGREWRLPEDCTATVVLSCWTNRPQRSIPSKRGYCIINSRR